MASGDRNVIVYTTPNCPDCLALKSWLVQRDISFEERDLTDPTIMEEAKTRYGVRVAPITVIGDWFTYGSFDKQMLELTQLLDTTERGSGG